MITANEQSNLRSVASAPKPPLRVGLLIDSSVQPQWIHRVISDIRASSVATLSLVIVNDEPAEWTSPGLNFGLYRLYSRVDAWFCTPKPDPFEKVTIEPLLSQVPVVHVTPIKKKFTDEIRPEDIAVVAEHRLDVLLRFGFRILKGEILTTPTYGVWSFHHGDNRRYRGGPPGFWEVMNDDPVTGAILQILSEELDNGRVIYRCFAETDRVSVRRGTHGVYWQASACVMRKLRQLHSVGPSALDGHCTSSWNLYSHRLYKWPTNREMLRFIGRIASRYLRMKLRYLLYLDQWFLAYKINPNANDVDGTFYRFRRLVPPKDRFWADPFPLKRDGKYYIFFEELPYKTRKGHLSVIQVDSRGIVDGPRTILERPHHLSYPFVFEWQGETYLIPETRQARRVELYRCTSFPDKWELDRVLLTDVQAVDTTIAEIAGRWWMFTSLQVEGTRHLYELHLYYADSPVGPWRPHEANPVKPETHTSRSSGRLVERDGSYYRPAQVGPGDSMILYKIEHLDPRSFVDVEAGRISPDWAPNIDGTHTLNSSDGLTVIDGLLVRRRYF